MRETSDEISQIDLSRDEVIFGLNVLRENEKLRKLFDEKYC